LPALPPSRLLFFSVGERAISRESNKIRVGLQERASSPFVRSLAVDFVRMADDIWTWDSHH